jgi:hypothetical protein
MKFDQKQRAVTFAAYKHLEGLAKKADGVCELPPGMKMDVSGETLTITLPPNTIVERQLGDGDGTCQKKATQNLYGWSILYAFTYQAERYLKKFRLHKKFRTFLQRFITRIVRQALDTGKTSEESFKTEFPEVAKGIEELKQSLNVPMRTEPMPRKCERKLPATLVFGKKKKKAA